MMHAPQERNYARLMWDFNCPIETTSVNQIKNFFRDHGQNWIFQIERTNDGNQIIRGKIKLIKRTTSRNLKRLIGLEQLILLKHGHRRFSYEIMDDLRIEGPWSDISYIDSNVRHKLLDLVPWQKSVINSFNILDSRSVNHIYYSGDNIGKLELIKYCQAQKFS